MRPLRTEDLTGRRFGRLKVLEFVRGDGPRDHRWRCICDCGTVKVTKTRSLRNGSTKSCGCLYLERSARLSQQYNYRHGMSHTRIHNIWSAMVRRCSNPNVQRYNRYGGRGIKVCREWGGFEAFYEWATANGYRDDLSIDRIDPDGGYHPENCRWIPLPKQSDNRRNTHHIQHDGEIMTLTEAAKRFGVPYHRAYQRIVKCGWSVERALTEPVSPRGRRDGIEERSGAS